MERATSMLRALALGVLALAASQLANAATTPVATYDVVDPPYTEGGLLAQKVGPTDGFYQAEWFPDATSVWTSTVANADIGSQDASNIASWIASTLGGTGLSLVFQVDSLGGGASGSWTFDSDVNWIALHYGNKETVWHFASGIDAFGMRFVEGNLGLSNIRAYSGDVGIVPIPAALPLFLSGLAGLGWLASRRKKLAA